MFIALGQIEIFLLILARISGLFISAPLLSARSIPSSIKTALAIWLASVIWFVAPVQYEFPGTVITFIIAIMLEIFIGYIIGFIANIIIQSIQAAGDLIDVQMGLSVANILSPTTGLMSSVIGTLTFYIALTIFLLVNGHHMVFSALYQSFKSLPVYGTLNFSNPNFILAITQLIQSFWLTALRLAAPSILLIFLMDFAFGLVSRVAPQVNVFMLGFQVKPSLGLFGLLITIPLFAKQISYLIDSIGVEVGKMLMILK